MHARSIHSGTDSLVAVVTGGSRGIGKGVAVALGSKGATVYVTGRTREAGKAPLPGTIHETAEAVTAAGGRGIAVACDHADDAQVKALFEQVARDSGRLDILVNNATALPEALFTSAPFWEKPLGVLDILDVGLRSHYVASYFAAPLMVRHRRGLIVHISAYGSINYLYGPAYGAGKAGLDKMAADMAVELRPHDVAAVSLWPGLIATERYSVLKQHQPELFPPELRPESPLFTGLLIDALFQDPERMSLSGRTLIGAELARRYSLRDVNGEMPPSYRELLGAPWTKPSRATD
ncbi:SDR family NAD(P)-dependent oxidoreductase [Vitiosangium sp. GDMCC 1.1324]|uniref:SDR family NAD(P)-dependent oxidoreductase n=1 Tax=Vitiosangium sp. (strain GDMCC 1.1324) TaxID=2138576 RepID=UPI000D33FCA1|nr:SDR family NAD(P)-dependent oxidoreductase [Vitiosangium sp. GDMCC 1.1324]PTL78415.1 short-chain dehydrogenase [Vitiosangium sp. GDMCC 1.1324]